MELVQDGAKSIRGRRPRYGDAVIPKNITFKRQILERLAELAKIQSQGNLSACVNDLLEEAFVNRDAEAALDAIAERSGVQVTEEDVQGATAWLLDVRQRVAAKRTQRVDR